MAGALRHRDRDGRRRGAARERRLLAGDDHHSEPYAYISPWTAEVSGELWQATGFRGAELTYAELLGAADPRAAALHFFTTRKEALA